MVLLLTGNSKEQKHQSCLAVGPKEVSAVFAECLSLGGPSSEVYNLTWEFKNTSKALKPFKLTAFTRFHILILPAFFPLADISQIAEVNTWPVENKAVFPSVFLA